MDRQFQLQIAKPCIRACVKRELMRIIDENRETIVRRAVVPERAVIYVEPSAEVLNEAYASLDNYADYVMDNLF